MGLSTRLLSEEAESRKQAKREAAQQLAEEQAEERLHRQQQAEEDEGPGQGDARPQEVTRSSDVDAPPGVQVAPSAAPQPVVEPAPTTGTGGTVVEGESGGVPLSASRVSSSDDRWQYDPNLGLYFQRSTQCYFDAGRSMYFRAGVWSRQKG